MLNLNQILFGTGVLMTPLLLCIIALFAGWTVWLERKQDARTLIVDIRFAKFICFYGCFGFFFFVIAGSAICYWGINILTIEAFVGDLIFSCTGGIFMTRACLRLARKLP